VTESHGGHGIGAALVAKVEAWAREHQFAALTLTTFTEVAWNGPWYERLGFAALTGEQTGPGLQAIRDAETAAGIDVSPRVAMRKSLDAP